MPPVFADASDEAVPLHAVDAADWVTWLSRQDQPVRAWLSTLDYSPKLGAVALVPDAEGRLRLAVAGLGDPAERERQRFGFARARGALPGGTYSLATAPKGEALEELALGWLLEGYRFTRYRKGPAPGAALVCPEGLDRARLETIAAGECLTRDLINTPSADMGPDELETAARDLSREYDGEIAVIRGEALLARNFPMIHAVGRASARAPRLVDLTFGDTGPRLTLVGKGVCFDTGGLNIKTGAGMSLMKKDMGGAATVLGLGRMILGLGLPVQLRVILPIVENAISGNSMRPMDILTSRKGLTVEVNDTDAEGRLILGDALALADEAPPDLLISMATLTGSARVAVGPDLAPFYATAESDARALRRAGQAVRDPVWELPFWAPYESMIEPQMADLDNSPSGSFAGSVTAALFLKRFVTATPRYMHFDLYGWQPTAAPARPKGGVGQGARAVLAALPELLGL